MDQTIVESLWHDIVQGRPWQTFLYIGIALVQMCVILVVLRRFPQQVFLYFILPIAFAGLSFYAAYPLARDGFDFLRLLSFGVFGGGTLVSLMISILAWPRFKPTAILFAFFAIAAPLITLEAFVLEPHNLEVTHFQIETKRLHEPLRIAVLSDLQTDHFGDYEKMALETMMREKPDLILFPGDYIQCKTYALQNQEAAKLRDYLRDHVQAPQGAFAVQGNTEAPNWPEIFQGTKITPIVTLSTVKCKNFDVTGMNLRQSFTWSLKIPRPSEKFHIACGHAPDFSRGQIDADLLVAGHTHGGQVQVPVLGPIVTLSTVSKKVGGGGLTALDSDRYLVVSRGVGMERGYAPRLRFLCRPQIVIIDVKPQG